MNELQLNDAEYALLIAINIFSAGKKPERSEELQQSESESTESRVKRRYKQKRSNKACIESSDKGSILFIIF